MEAEKPGKYYWKDLWLYRELFYFLAWRDVLVRYKQTVLGIMWSVLRPFLAMVIFTVIFGKLAKLPSDGVPYPILVYCAMLPWQFFSTSFSDCSTSLVRNKNLISKIYFPRIVIPTSTVIVSIIDFLISIVIFAGIMIWYRYVPSWQIVFIPILMLTALLTSMGLGLWLSAVNVKYRDIRYITPFIVRFGIYISPVGFSSTIIPEKWRLLYSLNPMVGVIDGFRWAVLGGSHNVNWLGFVCSTVVTIVLFLLGVWFFRRSERTFADVI
ncbi:MAG: ABC transporter permease [bacterium]|nr:ABC transporter permease [bacterium]